MAKKKRKSRNKEAGLISFPKLTSRDTANAIMGILSFVISILLILSAFSMGGRVGDFIYRLFTYLFGIGFYLTPVVLILISISLFKVDEDRDFATPQLIGSLLLFISTLGLIEIALAERGGLFGKMISTPLVSLFDVYASVIVLIAVFLVSILIIFDASVNPVSMFERFFGTKEVEDDLEENENQAIEKAVEKIEEGEDTKTSPEPKTQKGADSDGGFMPMIMKRRGKSWAPPPLSLLEKDRGKPGVGDIKANANLIKRTLMNFGIVVEMDEISIGPSVTRYALKPAEGVKLSKILGLQNNLELALAAHPVRIEAPIPGKSLVGIEVPNTSKSTIGLGSLLSEDDYEDSPKPLLISLGKDIAGKSHFSDLARMPHILVAGATGAGKSVTIHAVINSLIFRNPPENLKFIMIDPKRVELTLYNGIPHLLTPVITESKKSILALKWLIKEMERRYEVLEKEKVRDISSYHKNIFSPYMEKNSKKNTDEETGPEPMPYIVVIIDELADLMQSYPRELESAIVRLAQMSRAVGIHLILSTQRPSVNVITGLIKANVPARIALQVSSQIDSRTILDSAGAEKLLGAGDMLFMGGEMSKPVRIQSAFISEGEVKGVVKYLKEEYAEELTNEINLSPEETSNAIFSATIGDEAEEEDELYEDARQTVLEAGKASTSYLQRKLRIGYARAARLIDMLEERGVIGPGEGAKPREIIDGEAEGGDEEEI